MVGQHGGGEAQLQAVQARPGHAVVLRQTHHNNLNIFLLSNIFHISNLNILLLFTYLGAVAHEPPEAGVSGELDVCVVEECGVCVYQGVGALLDHLRLLGGRDARVELGSWNNEIFFSRQQIFLHICDIDTDRLSPECSDLATASVCREDTS